MTKILLIRHAEAEGNIYRRAHGQYNGLITNKGEKQIELLKNRLMSEHIDAVYSSDLSRAFQTAGAVAEPRNLQITADPALREVDMGSWEDVPWGEIEYKDPEMNVVFNSDPAKWKIEGGEPYEAVSSRMYDYISEIAKQHDGEIIAVFSHGFAIRTFLTRVRGLPSEETSQVPYCDNTAVTLLTYDAAGFDTGFNIEYAGDNSHLSAGESTLEKQSWWRAPIRQRPENLRYVPVDDTADKEMLQKFKAKAGDRASADTQYAAFLENEPIGIVGLDTKRGENSKIGWISYIYVVSLRRKTTFGTQLLGQAISEYRKLGRERLCIELFPGKAGAEFLSKHGFKTISKANSDCCMEKDIRN